MADALLEQFHANQCGGWASLACVCADYAHATVRVVCWLICQYYPYASMGLGRTNAAAIRFHDIKCFRKGRV